MLLLHIEVIKMGVSRHHFINADDVVIDVRCVICCNYHRFKPSQGRVVFLFDCPDPD